MPRIYRKCKHVYVFSLSNYQIMGLYAPCTIKNINTQSIEYIIFRGGANQSVESAQYQTMLNDM